MFFYIIDLEFEDREISLLWIYCEKKRHSYINAHSIFQYIFKTNFVAVYLLGYFFQSENHINIFYMFVENI